jgi:RNA polymerase sigma factor (sigma-70 family)
MAIGRDVSAPRDLHCLFRVGALGSLTDAQLLERAAAGQVELAFTVLIERHGPMVLRVCRSVLRDEHEAQDAFQDTFLVLARRLPSLGVVGSLEPWLYGVARRVASSARAASARRRRRERQAAELVTPRPPAIGVDPDLGGSIREEIDRLPERYRVPVALCLLEGLSPERAARQAGWPVGTIKSRLAKGRERLRARLARRGLAPGAALVAGASLTRPAEAAMTASLVGAAARAAAGVATGRASAGMVPAVASLTAGTRRRGLMMKACLVSAALALVAFGPSPIDEDGRSATGVKFTFVDLGPKGNHKRADALGDLAGNNLAPVPGGRQKLAGTWFQVGEQIIRVRGRRSPEPPGAARDITIGARFDTLHILHSTMFGNAFGAEDGTEIGAYVVRYADGSQARIPIVYGVDVRDWWRDSDPAEPSRGKLAWIGRNEATGDSDEIRLFASEWTNPHPDRRVEAIDFETKDTVAAPFLVALTLERTIHRKSDEGRR